MAVASVRSSTAASAVPAATSIRQSVCTLLLMYSACDRPASSLMAVSPAEPASATTVLPARSAVEV